MSQQTERIVSENERSFIIKALNDEIRTDARNFDSSRRTSIVFGDDWGTVHVSIGSTQIFASVTGEIVKPMNDRGNEGSIQFNIDFSSMGSPYFDSTRPSKKSVEIARLVERCVKDAGAVDVETLCIVAGAHVWNLRVDVHVINYEGNLVDSCVLASVCALLYYRRPDISVTSNNITIHSENEKNFIPIQLNFWPVTNTYAVFKCLETHVAVVDPSLLEDLTCDAHITVAMTAQKEICCIQKPGGLAVSSDLVMQCVERAYERTKHISELIKKEYQNKLNLKSHVIFGNK